MARKLRIQYPAAIYHAMNRGDRREAIFADDADRRRWVETPKEVCQKSGWQVHAYCLMSNHFHLVIETPQANLVAGMKFRRGCCNSVEKGGSRPPTIHASWEYDNLDSAPMVDPATHT